MTTPTQVRIDSNIKKDATILFESLGLDMSSAINLFLYQCVLTGGLPFKIENPNFKKKTLDAIAEAKNIASDPNVKSYDSIEDLEKALNEE